MKNETNTSDLKIIKPDVIASDIETIAFNSESNVQETIDALALASCSMFFITALASLSAI